MLRLFLIALAFLLISDDVASAQSGRRVALVVGVSGYKYVPRLGNPTNDALDISNAFYRLGFQVQTLIDPDRNGLEDAIRKLGRDAEGADAGVFYYSGHALEVNGQNLLVPASANIRSERDLRFETVDLDSVLDSVSGRSKVSLLILDSCRDNPFIKQLAGSSRAVSLRGMGPVDATVGTLIAFSTAPGKTATTATVRSRRRCFTTSSGRASRFAACSAMSGGRYVWPPAERRYPGRIRRLRASSFSSRPRLSWPRRRRRHHRLSRPLSSRSRRCSPISIHDCCRMRQDFM